MEAKTVDNLSARANAMINLTKSPGQFIEAR